MAFKLEITLELLRNRKIADALTRFVMAFPSFPEDPDDLGKQKSSFGNEHYFSWRG